MKTRKKLKQKKSRNAVRASVKSVRRMNDVCILASDFDPDDEGQSPDVLLRRVKRTAIVVRVGRLHVFDHQSSAEVDAETTSIAGSRRRGVTGGEPDDTPASGPDHQAMWRIVLGRTLNTPRQTAPEVGASWRA